MAADIIGNALRDYMDGVPDVKILVHSSIAETDEMTGAYLYRDYEQMPELEKLALAECRGSIADLGAGAGSHALYLQKQNLPVTAFDISKGACRVMKKRGVKEVQNIPFNQLENEKFDTILMLMNGLGLTGNLDGLAFFFEKVKKHLNPGGQIIADSSDISYMFYDEEGALNLNLAADYYGEVTYQMEYKGVTGKPFNWLFIEFAILEDYAEKAGFACQMLYEDEHFHYLVKLTLL